MPKYEFQITLNGQGNTQEEAWEAATLAEIEDNSYMNDDMKRYIAIGLVNFFTALTMINAERKPKDMSFHDIFDYLCDRELSEEQDLIRDGKQDEYKYSMGIFYAGCMFAQTPDLSDRMNEIFDDLDFLSKLAPKEE